MTLSFSFTDFLNWTLLLVVNANSSLINATHNELAWAIRLDRMELGIPELRRRIKDVATQNHDEIKSSIQSNSLDAYFKIFT